MRSRWGGTIRRSAALFAVTFALLALVAAPATAQRERQQRQANCEQSTTGKTPLTDLGSGEYQGAQGGLYPQGSNDIPDAHLALGLSKAAAITPRDASGAPAADGKIGFAAIGYSNIHRAFGAFAGDLRNRGGVAQEVAFLNGAQGGADMAEWVDPRERAWDVLDSVVSEAGVTPQQVQAVWVSLTDTIEGSVPPFPDHALGFADDLTSVLQMLQDEFPNLQVAYLSTREYGGYNTESSPSPEPLAYEEAFGVKWAIERQMNGEAGLNTDPTRGEVEVPWMVWGPYLWADGTSPRSDGLTWSCSDFRGDGVHPDNRGNLKYGGLIADFFQAEPTAAWMFTGRELPDLPDGGTPTPPPSTIAPGGGSGDEEEAGEDATGQEDLTEDERRRQERDQRRQERRDREQEGSGSSTTAPPPTTDPGDGAATTAAPPDSTEPPGDAVPLTRETGSVPPIVWILIGAGGALGIAAIAVLVARRGGNAGPGT